jgi:hypothetical protein
VNPNNGEQVYAGTDWGVYYTDDITVASPTWQRLRTAFRTRWFGTCRSTRLHHAFSLDAQSRGLRLSLAGRRYSQSHSNTDINTDCDTDSNSHCHGKRYTDTETYTHTEICADAEAASYAAATAVARN